MGVQLGHAGPTWANLRHRRNMQLGDDQKMNRRPGVDVMKGKNLIVFIDLAAGDFACGYFAKNAVVGVAHVIQGRGWLVAGR